MIVLGINAYHGDASAAILVDGRQDAESEPGRHGKQKRHRAEEERDRERLLEDFGHRASLVDEGVAEVTPHGLGHEDAELLVERLVQPVVGGQRPLRLGRQRIGPLRHRVHRAARRGVHHQERHERHGQDGRDEPQQP